MESLFIKLLNNSISAGWLVLAVLLARLLLKKAPKRFRCALWALVGLRLVVPVRLKSVFSLVPSAVTVSENIMLDPTPAVTSGIRVGTPAATTRGLDEDDFVFVGRLIADIIKNGEDAVERVAARVREITDRYPLYSEE